MINHHVLVAMAAGMGSPLGSIVAAFRASTREDMDRLRTFVASGDREQLVLHAHRLKGAAQMIGAGAVAEACDRLEAAALGGAAAAVAAALAALERDVAGLDTYLETLDA